MRTYPSVLRVPVRQPVRLLCALALGLSTVGCFRDTPVEPGVPLPAGPELADATAAGNITDLGDLGGGRSVASGINADGQIVGWSWYTPGLRHAFSWQSGKMTDLGTLGGLYPTSIGTDINDAGQIVGASFYQVGEAGFASAFLWQNGTMSDLGRLPGATSATAYAINKSGVVVGESETSSCFEEAVLWRNGSVNDLGSLGSGCGVASDINDDGQVVGQSLIQSGEAWHAFLWANGAMRDLGTLGGPQSTASGINSFGQVVGTSGTSGGGDHAFLWANGSMSDLGTLGGPTSSGLDINDNGVIVGSSRTASGTSRNPVYHAFFWKSGVMSDLGTLAGDNTSATAINSAGVVAGESKDRKDGPERAVRWTIPTTDFWSERAVLSARRVNAVGTAGGLLYSIGGTNTAGTTLPTVQAYNPGTNAWSTKAPLPAARQAGDGAATIAGIIYVAGGKNASKCSPDPFSPTTRAPTRGAPRRTCQRSVAAGARPPSAARCTSSPAALSRAGPKWPRVCSTGTIPRPTPGRRSVRRPPCTSCRLSVRRAASSTSRAAATRPALPSLGWMCMTRRRTAGPLEPLCRRHGSRPAAA
jgi:probable HAF family extracellular repeat protein